jgi:hypothetical protein
MQNAKLTTYQTGTYTGTKLFNKLLSAIISLNHNAKTNKLPLKDYLLAISYSVKEFTLLENSEVLLIFMNITVL